MAVGSDWSWPGYVPVTQQQRADGRRSSRTAGRCLRFPGNGTCCGTKLERGVGWRDLRQPRWCHSRSAACQPSCFPFAGSCVAADFYQRISCRLSHQRCHCCYRHLYFPCTWQGKGVILQHESTEEIKKVLSSLSEEGEAHHQNRRIWHYPG